MGEVELGGLEEDEDVPLFGSTDEEYRLFVREEVGFSSLLSYVTCIIKESRSDFHFCFNS